VTGIHVERDGMVGVVELRRPPHNFFDEHLVREIADAFEEMDADPDCRAIVLAAEGSSFCAGADFSAGRRPEADRFAAGGDEGAGGAANIYRQGLRLFAIATPVVAAVHGPAVGGGLGLALVADFRITCPRARWSANFSRLGFHPGFALTVTLPELVGGQHARMLFYTGRRIGGEEAAAIGLADECVDDDRVRERSMELAVEIAGAAPLVVQAVKRTLTGDRLERLRAATEHELAEQVRLLATEDAAEGIAAYAQRRPAEFKAR
jgi:enoyl-CoA hydratase/carnithine racemase